MKAKLKHRQGVGSVYVWGTVGSNIGKSSEKLTSEQKVKGEERRNHAVVCSSDFRKKKLRGQRLAVGRVFGGPGGGHVLGEDVSEVVGE